ncbi:MAG: DNA polymerase zeta [Thelocarpon impressellum]|nr:MAG: DNA polymerase zeta [Thelocarpon impressellum]
MALFRLRLNCVDHYQATPSHLDPPLAPRDGESRPKEAPRVPVIRVFGATPTGQKVCAHIHGALPYLYVEYTGGQQPHEVDAYISRLHLSIDQALAASYRRNMYDGKTFFVARITLTKGTPFYGFHVGYRFFLKIYLLDPLSMTRLADLLRQGGVMKQVFQPYESHLQYLLQWMCDFNLYGCGYIDCKRVSFRHPVPSFDDLRDDAHLWHDQSVSPDMLSDKERFPRQSHCALEVDIHVRHILNRREIKARPLHHDFVERENPIPADEKLVHSMAGLWRDETRRRKARMGYADPGSSPFPAEVLISMSASPRSSQRSGWIHEDDFRDKIAALIAEERLGSDPRPPSFDGFVRPAPLERIARTTFESVEDLFPEDTEEEEVAASQAELGASDAELETLIPSSLEELSSGASDKYVARDFFLARPTKDPSELTPTSSGKLSDAGVHAVPGRRLEDDIFDVPVRFASDVEGTTAMMECGMARASRHARDKTKRETIFDAERPAQQKAMLDDDSIETGEEDAPRVASRAKPKPSAPKGDKKLSLPVVKDPLDPETIWRSSQRSEDTFKASQLSPTFTAQTKASPAATSSENATSNAASSLSASSQVVEVAAALPSSFAAAASGQVLCIAQPPPTASSVTSSFAAHGLPTVVYQDAYYGDEKDVPARPREYAGREFRLQSTTTPFLPDFNPSGGPTFRSREKWDQDQTRRRRACKLRSWEICAPPPSRREVEDWAHGRDDGNESGKESAGKRRRAGACEEKLSQIEGPTQAHLHGFKYSQRYESTSVEKEVEYMSMMSVEVHVNTRGDLMPDPEKDDIVCVFWCLQGEDELEGAGSDGTHVGILALDPDGTLQRKLLRQAEARVETEATELDLINRMIDIVRMYDPDILTGYEVHGGSWGYLIERARRRYGFNLCDEFSRVRAQSHGRFGKENDRWGFDHTSTIRVTGRHMINVWRAMRGEVNLLQYTAENVAFHLLQRRIPHYHHRDLTRWFTEGKPRELSRVIDYYLCRARLDLEILERNELVARTSEQARLLGVDFFSVMSRGSQFKVESLMFRIAKPESLVLVSPGRQQVGGQNALECLPLVMEPASAFYPGPVVVLDFTSLYPSVMIAYNYCYSTFLGRIVSWRGRNKMGFADYRRERRLVELLKEHINVAPNGTMYVRPEVRKSLLAKMLGEILETRVMVKSGMKADGDDKALQALLNNRQLALKLIANVTYGYTSASFSGRMPCAEIADSIVQTARETLERAIALIYSVERWGAEVVYGDTDSLFVHLPGRSKDEAFAVGEEMSRAVTDMNPRPVKLKFEKVYLPCVLLAKKRYVGFKYERRDQEEPDFDAKGIETVRRDGTPAEQKIEERALKTLFRTADLSQVKAYFQRQCDKIMRGRVSVQDFCFAREVRLGSYSDKGPPPAGALISARRMLTDPRAEPQHGERVPYVVVTGAPGSRLIDRSVAPERLLEDPRLALDAEYYIGKNLIPPLERIFNLVGANVRAWYDEMPKVRPVRSDVAGAPTRAGQATLETFLKISLCTVCRGRLPNGRRGTPLCARCAARPAQSLLALRGRLKTAERRTMEVNEVCRSCAGLAPGEEVRCDSKDCPVFYTRTRQQAALASTRATTEPVLTALEAAGTGAERDALEW